MPMHHATNAYRNVRRASLVENKSPHELTLMLFDGALRELSLARCCIESGELQLLRRALDKAIAIVQELQGTLRDTDTVELAANLFSLYGFIIDRLLEANRTNSVEPLDSAEQVLSTLREAWAGIESVRDAA